MGRDSAWAQGPFLSFVGSLGRSKSRTRLDGGACVGVPTHGGVQPWEFPEVLGLLSHRSHSLLRDLSSSPSAVLLGLPHKTLQPGTFEQQKCISHGSGGENSKTGGVATLVPPEASLHGLGTAPSLWVSSLDLSPVSALGVSPCVQKSSPCKDSQQIGSGPHSRPHFRLTTSVKVSSAVTVTF